MNFWEILPEELLLREIFTYLSSHEICALKVVNKTFKSICSRKEIWKFVVNKKYRKERVNELLVFFEDYKEDWRKIFELLRTSSQISKNFYSEIYDIIDNEEKEEFRKLFPFLSEENVEKLFSMSVDEFKNKIELFQRITPSTLQSEDNETVFEGELVNGEKVIGTEYFDGGAKYVGGFKGDLLHGENCIYYFSNGDRFEGNFVDDRKFGDGTYYYEDGSVFRGYFVKGKAEKRGKYFFRNGSTFSGEYRRDRRHGVGKLHGKIGIFEGFWRYVKANGNYDLLNGKVKLFDKKEKGKVVEEMSGTWINGVNKKFEHPKFHFFSCLSCGDVVIIGKKYKCTISRDYRVCEKCYEKEKNDPQHKFQICK